MLWNKFNFSSCMSKKRSKTKMLLISFHQFLTIIPSPLFILHGSTSKNLDCQDGTVMSSYCSFIWL